MTAPGARPGSRAAQLAAEAAEAAEVRDALTHPDVVALRVEKVRERVDRFIWAGMILGLLFTMTNVQQFAAYTAGAAPGSLGWWAAWLLDPTVSVILLGVLLAEREVSRWQVPVGPWARAAKWVLLAATYVMNTWEAWAAGDAAGIVLHSVPVVAVFMGAEAVTDCQDKLTEAVHRAHAAATERAARKAAAEREAKAHAEAPAGTGRAPEPVVTAAAASGPAPFPAVASVGAARGGAPVLRAVPSDHPPRPADESAERAVERPLIRSAPGAEVRPADRPQPAPVVRPAGRSGARGSGRSGRGRRARTDQQLAAEVRALAAANGGRLPSQYQLKQRFGIGSTRAARLLAGLDADNARAVGEEA